MYLPGCIPVVVELCEHIQVPVQTVTLTHSSWPDSIYRSDSLSVSALSEIKPRKINTQRHLRHQRTYFYNWSSPLGLFNHVEKLQKVLQNTRIVFSLISSNCGTSLCVMWRWRIGQLTGAGHEGQIMARNCSGFFGYVKFKGPIRTLWVMWK